MLSFNTQYETYESQIFISSTRKTNFPRGPISSNTKREIRPGETDPDIIVLRLRQRVEDILRSVALSALYYCVLSASADVMITIKVKIKFTSPPIHSIFPA